MPKAILGRRQRRFTPYSRPKAYVSRQRGSAGMLALAKVNRVIKQREVKDFRTVSTSAGILSGGQLFHFSNIPQGDDSGSREGNRVYVQVAMLNIQLRSQGQMVSNGGVNHLHPPTKVRIIVFKSKADSTEVLAAGVNFYLSTTGLAGATNYLAFKSNDNWMRNKTLHDHVYQLPAMPLANSATGYGGMRLNVSLKLRTGGVLEFTGSTTVTNMNGYYVIILPSVDNNVAGNAVDLTMVSSLRYVDP